MIQSSLFWQIGEAVQKLRKILFYLFFLVYAVLCPFLIMYTLGYIMNPGEDEQLVRTGAVYVFTAPAGAEISIGGEFSGKKSPDFIQGLTAGDYEVLLTLEGHRDWKETMPVEAGKTTVIDTVLFLPEKVDINLLLSGKYSKILGIRGTDKAVLMGGGSLAGIFIYDCARQEGSGLVSAEDSAKNIDVEKIFTVDGSPYIMIEAGAKGGKKYFWSKLDQEKTDMIDVSDLFGTSPEKIKWSAGSEDEIFVFGAGQINKIDLKERAVYPAIVKDVRGYGVDEGSLYVVGSDNILFETDTKGENRKDIMADPGIAATALPQKGFVSIEVLDQDILIFKGEDGSVFANKLPYEFVSAGTIGTEFDKNTLRLLVWKKDKIGVIDFSVEVIGKTDFEKGPSITWLYEGKNIKDAFWAYQASHVIFVDGGELIVMEILEGGKVIVSNTTDKEDISHLLYSEDEGTAYFIESRAEGLSSVNVVPSKSFLPQNFDMSGFEEDQKSGGGQ